MCDTQRYIIAKLVTGVQVTINKYSLRQTQPRRDTGLFWWKVDKRSLLTRRGPRVALSDRLEIFHVDSTP
jgi:hypothetical protein